MGGHSFNRIEGRAYRLLKPHKVADEIERIYSETKIDYFEFTGGTFNAPLDYWIMQRRFPMRSALRVLKSGSVQWG